MDQESWLYQLYLDTIKGQEKVNERLDRTCRKKKGFAVLLPMIRDISIREDWRAHEILMNIQSGEPCEIWEKDSHGNPKAARPQSQTASLPIRMSSISNRLKKCSAFCRYSRGACKTTADIAAQCQFEFDFKTRFYPVFVPPHLEGKIFHKRRAPCRSGKVFTAVMRRGDCKALHAGAPGKSARNISRAQIPWKWSASAWTMS